LATRQRWPFWVGGLAVIAVAALVVVLVMYGPGRSHGVKDEPVVAVVTTTTTPVAAPPVAHTPS
jgi:hypothetical protein